MISRISLKRIRQFRASLMPTSPHFTTSSSLTYALVNLWSKSKWLTSWSCRTSAEFGTWRMRRQSMWMWSTRNLKACSWATARPLKIETKNTVAKPPSTRWTTSKLARCPSCSARATAGYRRWTTNSLQGSKSVHTTREAISLWEVLRKLFSFRSKWRRIGSSLKSSQRIIVCKRRSLRAPKWRSHARPSFIRTSGFIWSIICLGKIYPWVSLLKPWACNQIKR